MRCGGPDKISLCPLLQRAQDIVYLTFRARKYGADSMVWRLTVNELKISALFVRAPTRKRCCYEVSRDLSLPVTTTFNSLISLKQQGWMQTEEERVNRSLSQRPGRILYRITEYGIQAAFSALTPLQISGTILLSS